MKNVLKQKFIAASATGAMLLAQAGGPVGMGVAGGQSLTQTPIQHVIIIIGENRTFDHLFGTYVPPKGQTVLNLLSEGIVQSNGQPGPQAFIANQYEASNTSTYSISPILTNPYSTLPQPNVGNPTTYPPQQLGQAPFTTAALAGSIEPGLLPIDDWRLTVGGTGIPMGFDTRFPDPLQNDPFQLTNWISYNAYAGSPVHRFFQMWQQLDCSIGGVAFDPESNPTGCAEDLFPWVEQTVAAGSNGAPPPSGGFMGEGAIAMGFYNNQTGDVPYFQQLARQYAISDNYHQAIMGGTGANHLAIGYGTTIFYADSNGNPSSPPTNQIENPNPQLGTNNFYTQDGYSGGSYVNCCDSTQPGVAPILDYLSSLSYVPNPDCIPKAYYLVNNYNPGYYGTGQVAFKGGAQDFTIPPSKENNIGLVMSNAGVSWRYYGEGWANGTETGPNGTSEYCNICNPFLYSTQIMTNDSLRSNLKDTSDLYNDIKSGTLPAVSIVKPDGFLDGHPASSKFDLFEAFTRKIITMVKANKQLWASTAIFITVDEGGGYYDSGYVQILDFFGEGTRIPLIVVSPYTQGGAVVHTYYDHVSLVKFIEYNWNLPHISATSRDNLPNPAASSDPYVPINQPAIGNLLDMFGFSGD
jgi:phospholipase C